MSHVDLISHTLIQLWFSFGTFLIPNWSNFDQSWSNFGAFFPQNRKKLWNYRFFKWLMNRTFCYFIHFWPSGKSHLRFWKAPAHKRRTFCWDGVMRKPLTSTAERKLPNSVADLISFGKDTAFLLLKICESCCFFGFTWSWLFKTLEPTFYRVSSSDGSICLHCKQVVFQAFKPGIGTKTNSKILLMGVSF